MNPHVSVRSAAVLSLTRKYLFQRLFHVYFKICIAIIISQSALHFKKKKLCQTTDGERSFLGLDCASYTLTSQVLQPIRWLLSLKGIFKPARFLQEKENVVSGGGAQRVGVNYANKCSDTNSDEDSEGIG